MESILSNNFIHFRIFDTKFIMKETKFKETLKQNSHLGYCYEVAKKNESGLFDKVDIKLAKGFEAYSEEILDNPRLHEAGYDAFITGYVFAKTFPTFSVSE